MNRRCLQAMTAVAVALAGVVASASPAAAHGGDGAGPTNFLTEITGTSPAVDGLDLQVLEFGSQLQLTNRTGRDVVVLGYEGEPYLRIGEEGVFENRRSPATYINADRQGQTPVPDEADAEADPEWRKQSDGQTARWHDHRVHWMGSETPPAVQRDSSRPQVIYPEWAVPLRVGDREVEVTGTLTWVPGPDRWPWIGAAAAIALLVVAVSWRWWAPVLAVLTLGLVVGDIWHAVGLAWAPDVAGSPIGRFAAAAFIPVLGWGAGLWAVRMLWRRQEFGALLAAFCGLAVFLIGGLGDLSALARSQVPFLWGETAARWAVTASLGAGAGVAIAALVAMRRITGSFLGPRPAPATP